MGDKENNLTIQKKPIDKEYLKSTLRDFKRQVLDEAYSTHIHDNKNVLDKLDASENNTLLFDGEEINSGSSAGKSAYDIAVDNGFEGNEEEWLNSLKGETGANGKSAYEIALENGFSGTEQEWLKSLIGKDGTQIDAYTKAESDAKFATKGQIQGTGDTISKLRQDVDNALMVDGESNDFIRFGIDENGNYGYKQVGSDTVTPFNVNETQKTIYVTSTSIRYNGTGSKEEPLTCELLFDDLPYVANNNWLLDVYVEPFTVSLVNASYEENTVSSPTHILISLDPSTCNTINAGDNIKVVGKIYLSELG